MKTFPGSERGAQRAGGPCAGGGPRPTAPAPYDEESAQDTIQALDSSCPILRTRLSPKESGVWSWRERRDGSRGHWRLPTPPRPCFPRGNALCWFPEAVAAVAAASRRQALRALLYCLTVPEAGSPRSVWASLLGVQAGVSSLGPAMVVLLSVSVLTSSSTAAARLDQDPP